MKIIENMEKSNQKYTILKQEGGGWCICYFSKDRQGNIILKIAKKNVATYDQAIDYIEDWAY